MALRLRLDEECLCWQAVAEPMPTVTQMKAMHPALRSRVLEKFLKSAGVREPEQTHIAMADALVFSEKPSAKACLPGGVTVARRYDALEVLPEEAVMEPVILDCPGEVDFAGFRIFCQPAQSLLNTADTFTVIPSGKITVRTRKSGDTMRLPGGTKSLKKLFIDRKIPAAHRDKIPVITDEQGVLGVYGIGANLERTADTLSAVTIHIINRD